MMQKGMVTSLALTVLLATTACQNTVDRLARVGLEPELKKAELPQEKVHQKPMEWPVQQVSYNPTGSVNSLWNPDSKQFFKDNRARFVGDILTVNVSISDSAEIENTTEGTRNGTNTLSAPGALGLQEPLLNLLPGNPSPTSLINTQTTAVNEGEGTIEREETIDTQLAAVITQILPNGNYVIYGSQEVRVNFEVRQLVVEGVIRPDDIDPNNTIPSDRIAEARIVYGGRGQITDLQQPRLGTQILDILSPF